MRRLLAICIGVFLARTMSAQAPVITPGGDPSVKSDTIYKLAVNPADHPEEAIVWLLDDGVLRYDDQGRESRTYRKIVQILKQQAVEPLSEQSFSYSPGHEKMTINWMRVVKPTGEVVSETPTHIQESDVPARMGDPVYSDRKVKRVSLTGLAPGTILDYSVTTEELKPFLPGDFFNSWLVNPEMTILRSRYMVDVPAAIDLRIREDNLNFPRQVKTVGNRKVYTWATANIPRIKGERFASDSNGVRMTIMIGSPITWAKIASWYATNAKDRYTVTPAVAAKLADVVKGASTREDSIRAIHRWIAQDIRYVSIALGIGGYQPRTPDEVVATGYGDCKDKATLFIAALDKMGVTAYPVILNSRGGVRRELPTIEQLDHETPTTSLTRAHYRAHPHRIQHRARRSAVDRDRVPRQSIRPSITRRLSDREDVPSRRDRQQDTDRHRRGCRQWQATERQARYSSGITERHLRCVLATAGCRQVGARHQQWRPGRRRRHRGRRDQRNRWSGGRLRSYTVLRKWLDRATSGSRVRDRRIAAGARAGERRHPPWREHPLDFRSKRLPTDRGDY